MDGLGHSSWRRLVSAGTLGLERRESGLECRKFDLLGQWRRWGLHVGSQLARRTSTLTTAGSYCIF